MHHSSQETGCPQWLMVTKLSWDTHASRPGLCIRHDKQPCHPACLRVHGLRALQGGAGHLRQRAGGPLLHALAVQQVRLQRIAAGDPLQSVASRAERGIGLSFQTGTHSGRRGA